MAVDVILPPGFRLDQQNAGPPLPDGFQLDKPDVAGGAMGAAASGAADALSGGWGDELMGEGARAASLGGDLGQRLLGDTGRTIGQGIGSALVANPITGPATMYASHYLGDDKSRESAKVVTQAMRDYDAASAAAHPWAHMAGETAGFVAPMLASGGASLGAEGMAALGAKTLPTVGATRLAGMAARAGANAVDAGAQLGVYGAGSANPSPDASPADALAQRAEAGLGAGTVGAITGGALSPALDVGQAALWHGLVAPAVSRLFPDSFASAKIAQGFGRDRPWSDGTPSLNRSSNARIAAAPGAMLADAGGSNILGIMRSALNTPNEARNGFLAKLNLRQSTQPGKVVDAIGDNLGIPTNGTSYEQALDDTLGQAQKTAGPLYRQSFEGPAASDPANRQLLTNLFNTPLGKTLMDRADTHILNDMRTPDAVNEMERVHYAKLALDKMIGDMKAKVPDSSIAGFDMGQLVAFKNRLFGNLAQNTKGAVDNPLYQQARSTYAGPAALRSAMQQGAEEARTAAPYEIQKSLAGLNPSEQAAYRFGGLQAHRESLMAGNMMRDRVQGKLMDPMTLQRVKALMPDLKSFRQFQAEIGVLGKQAQVRRAAMGNSSTAAQLKEDQEATQIPEAIASAAQTIGSVATGHAPGVLAGLAAIGKRYAGMTPRVAASVLKQLGSRQTGEIDALVPVLRNWEVRRQIANNAASQIAARGAGSMTVSPQSVENRRAQLARTAMPPSLNPITGLIPEQPNNGVSPAFIPSK